NQKWLITQKQSKTNTLVVAPENHPLLKTKEIKLKKLHLINKKVQLPKTNLKARIRHLGTLHPGKLKISQPGRNITSKGCGVASSKPGEASSLKGGLAKGTVVPLQSGARQISFIPNKPILAVAPGQTLVLYHNQELVASAEITT
ncbi:hypothetical protein CMI48_01015, partial [Candidatus Pacearchaeota archaeon]|nr:hypothetical protein [Candidatus Pacearchaeota archaeon]